MLPRAQYRAFLSTGSAAILAASLFFLPKTSRANIDHVIAPGHTIQAIAHRYRVSIRSILEANHLTDARHLKIGETIVIPGVGPRGGGGDSAKGKTHPMKAAPGVAGKPGQPAQPVNYVSRPKVPNLIHAKRLSTSEDFAIRVPSRVSSNVTRSFEKLMRSSGNLTHPVDPRLVALVRVVSNHFGGRKIEVVSGFRPYSPKQYTAHSNHNVGKALDFRIPGIPNEVLRDYCRTLKNVGVGYYPNSTFVHMDARETPAFWVDYSKPGEPPRYNAADVAADEGANEVAEEVQGGPDAPLVPGPTTTPTAPASETANQAPKAAAPAEPAAPSTPATVE